MERGQFEAWALTQKLLLDRVASNTRYESMETEWAYRAWVARTELAEDDAYHAGLEYKEMQDRMDAWK
jgi:hypothetical protein